MGRKSMPPLSSQPESVEAKLGMALCCAPAPAAMQTATEVTSAAPHSKHFLNITGSLSGRTRRLHPGTWLCITSDLRRECPLGSVAGDICKVCPILKNGRFATNQEAFGRRPKIFRNGDIVAPC